MSSYSTVVITALGRSTLNQPNAGKMVLQVVGTGFSGTWRVVRSTDDGATWVGTTNLGSPVTFSGDVVEMFDDPDDDAIYNVEMVSGTGTLAVRWAWL